VSLDISFKNDFAPVFGTESISQIKGSTKLRAVLAYHAAFLELVSRESRNFNLLILDTPKQHDINNEDLNNFVTALKQVASKYSIQVVFSSTEYHYDCDSRDAEWNPVYPGQKHKMFLNSNFVAVTKD
jgi:arabinogalactan endo-1,4-beta-galactosidase